MGRTEPGLSRRRERLAVRGPAEAEPPSLPAPAAGWRKAPPVRPKCAFQLLCISSALNSFKEPTKRNGLQCLKVLGIFKTAVLFKASSVWNTCDLLSLIGLQLAWTLCDSHAALPFFSLSQPATSFPVWGQIRSQDRVVSCCSRMACTGGA